MHYSAFFIKNSRFDVFLAFFVEFLGPASSRKLELELGPTVTSSQTYHTKEVI
jgi:hypothetical protein